MDFINKAAEFFSGYNYNNLPGDIIQFICIFAILGFIISYAAKHHAGWYSGLIVLEVIIIGALVVLGKINNSWLIRGLIAVMAMSTFAIFANEIKRDLFKFSLKAQNYNSEETVNLSPEELKPIIASIVKSCQSLSKSETGALIVICQSPLSDYVTESGTTLNAEISSELIETVFYPKCPLHDGAMLIIGNKIISAGCYLPLTQKPNLPTELGTRHRAAIGISENDPTVTAIVVSEESGIISVTHDGCIKRYMDAEQLTQVLEYAFNFNDQGKEYWKHEQE